MRAINLAFKGYDVHELACHFVARHAGLYERHGLQPRLLDSTFLADEELPARSFHAACGAALAAWLKGADRRVVFVAAERPMFWLYGAPGQGLQDLRDRPVAGYPDHAPPAAFLRQTWAGEGLDAAGLRVVAARDDVARLGLLRDGSVEAAMLSSAVSPAAMQNLGYVPLRFLGDDIQLATTGLAVAGDVYAKEPELVAQLCACYREAIGMLHGEPQLLDAALAEVTTATGVGAQSLAAPLRQCYSRDGTGQLAHLGTGAGLMARAMGVEARAVEGLYDFSFLS